MELFNALGLNVKILIAQFINFAVLLFVFWKFGYTPMAKFLEGRRKKIEKGIEDAQKAEEKLEQIIEKEKNVLKKAKKEASKILDEARAQADDNRKKSIEKAKIDIGKVINKEKENIHLEKAETLKQIKAEVVDLVVLVVEKIIDQKMDNKKDKELIEKTIKSIK